VFKASVIGSTDTVSIKILNHLGIKKPLVSYYEHNRFESGEKIISRILAGENCVLVSDAGMPAISDPGEDIARCAAEAGINVTVIPGACAAVTALALSGLPTGRFTFEGFLSAQAGERRRALDSLKHEERTMIFYEAPHKLKATLRDMISVFGEERKIALCRELTKLNEEIIRTTLSRASMMYEESEPRGEYVIIVEGGSAESSEDNPLLMLSPEEHVIHYEKLGYKSMDAIKAAARDRGMAKSELYKILHE